MYVWSLELQKYASRHSKKKQKIKKIKITWKGNNLVVYIENDKNKNMYYLYMATKTET